MNLLRCSTSLLVVVLASSSLLAEENPVDEVRRIGAESRKAAIRQTLERPGGMMLGGTGLFISPDGLALFNSGLFCTRTKARFHTAGGEELDFGAVLAVFPDQELLLMKFDHEPQVWLPVAAAEPVRGDYLSIVVLDKLEKLEESTVRPMVARMLGTKTKTISNYRDTHFSRVLTVGCHPRLEQVKRMLPGTFAVDRHGHLAGFQHGTEKNARKVFHLTSLHGVHGLIEQALAAGDKLPFPLPEEKVLTDRASLDGDYTLLGAALRQGDRVRAAEISERLRKRYPESRLVRLLSIRLAGHGDPGLPELPAANQADPVPQRIGRHLDRVQLLHERGDSDGAVWECEATVKISPEGFTDPLIQLATIFMLSGKPEAAEPVFRKVCEVEPDNLDLLMGLGSIQERLGKFEELQETAQRAKELEQWYPEN